MVSCTLLVADVAFEHHVAACCDLAFVVWGFVVCGTVCSVAGTRRCGTHMARSHPNPDGDVLDAALAECMRWLAMRHRQARRAHLVCPLHGGRSRPRPRCSALRFRLAPMAGTGAVLPSIAALLAGGWA